MAPPFRATVSHGHGPIRRLVAPRAALDFCGKVILVTTGLKPRYIPITVCRRINQFTA